MLIVNNLYIKFLTLDILSLGREGVYILVITPSKYMCHWLAEAVRELIKDYRLKIAIVNDNIPIGMLCYRIWLLFFIDLNCMIFTELMC